jgi:hypothetical protein
MMQLHTEGVRPYMIRNLVVERNDSEQSARITISGYLVEVGIVLRNLGTEAWDVNMIDKNTGGVDQIASTGDFDAAIKIGTDTLRGRAVDEKIDGYESLLPESD